MRGDEKLCLKKGPPLQLIYRSKKIAAEAQGLKRNKSSRSRGSLPGGQNPEAVVAAIVPVDVDDETLPVEMADVDAVAARVHGRSPHVHTGNETDAPNLGVCGKEPRCLCDVGNALVAAQESLLFVPRLASGVGNRILADDEPGRADDVLASELLALVREPRVVLLVEEIPRELVDVQKAHLARRTRNHGKAVVACPLEHFLLGKRLRELCELCLGVLDTDCFCDFLRRYEVISQDVACSLKRGRGARTACEQVEELHGLLPCLPIVDESAQHLIVEAVFRENTEQLAREFVATAEVCDGGSHRVPPSVSVQIVPPELRPRALMRREI